MNVILDQAGRAVLDQAYAQLLDQGGSGSSAEPAWTSPLTLTAGCAAALIAASPTPAWYPPLTAALVDTEIGNMYPWRGVVGDLAAQWLQRAWRAGELRVSSGSVDLIA